MDIKLQQIINAGATFEQEAKDSIASKLKTKNIVIGILGFCLIASCAAIAVMMPLKEKIPVVIRVNTTTGETAIITNTDVSTFNTDKNEAIDKSNLANYVINRESYDWNYQESMYSKTLLMTDKEIIKDYQQNFSDDNPNAIDKKYQNFTRVIIENPSVSFYENSAMVRYTRKIITNNQIVSANQEMATIAYEYATADMQDADRIINPLGFQVKSYRIDKDLTNSTAIATPSTTGASK
jgi:type IV secretion system protein VirB8